MRKRKDTEVKKIKMKKICFIIPYFGEFKNYFPLWLVSCQYNPTVDWLIITDTQENYNWPCNVRRVYSSFEGFKERIQNNFDFRISLDTPYKLCDYKPVYGEVMYDELRPYEYWGYCDCDLIFGNIRKFITDDLLECYKKIFTRGHMTIFHNDSETNMFYRNQDVIDWKKVYTSDVQCAFDEWPGISSAWETCGGGYYDELPYDDITVGLDGLYPTKRYGRGNPRSPYHLLNDDESGKYKKMKHIAYQFDKGKLLRVWQESSDIKRCEILYVHLQKRNMNIDITTALHETERFIICSNEFLDWKEMSGSLLRSISPDKNTINNIIQNLRLHGWNIKRKLGKK